MIPSIPVGGSINLEGFLLPVLLLVVMVVTVVIVILIVVVVDDVSFILKLSFAIIVDASSKVEASRQVTFPSILLGVPLRKKMGKQIFDLGGKVLQDKEISEIKSNDGGNTEEMKIKIAGEDNRI
ncbi:hypothetical protein Tco_0514714 [Tanacetum coccineum]